MPPTPTRLPAPLLCSLLALGACISPPQTEPPLPAVPPQTGDLLIAELYTVGAAPAAGADHYFSDQFIELVNASANPLDLSGVRVADVWGAAGEINPGMQPDSYRESHPDQVVMSTVWRIPTGARLEPGEALVLAHDGTNHRPFSELDLSSAGFEAYAADSGRDDDHPLVENLEQVEYNAGSDWLMTVFGPSVVVLDADTPLESVAGPFGDLPVAPVSAVLDAVDTVMDADSAAFKRLPDSLDSGFAWVDSGPYSGVSLHRRRSGDGWQDTDDSGADFEMGAPDPARPSRSGDVYGTPEVELGTGASDFEPLVDGDGIELVAGLQGGWHLDVSLAFAGFGPAGVRLTYEAVDAEGDSISFLTQAELTDASVIEADDAWLRIGDRVVLDIADPTEVLGQDLVVRVTAALGGETWSDERTVVVVDEF